MGAGQGRRQEAQPTHVEAVLEPYSDEGSIPSASIGQHGGTASGGAGVPLFFGLDRELEFVQPLW